MNIAPNTPISFVKIRGGDAVEFERMFRLYYRRLCIYAENIIKNGDDAEEIVCNMFARMWSRREELVITVSVESYIFTCIYNEALNYLKHAAVEESYRQKYQLAYMDLLNGGSGDTPLSDMLDKELHEWINRAIDSLPPECRKVFLLHQVDGLSYGEVANRLNVSINTVRTQITRATKKLRAALSPLRSLRRKRR